MHYLKPGFFSQAFLFISFFHNYITNAGFPSVAKSRTEVNLYALNCLMLWGADYRCLNLNMLHTKNQKLKNKGIVQRLLRDDTLSQPLRQLGQDGSGLSTDLSFRNHMNNRREIAVKKSLKDDDKFLFLRRSPSSPQVPKENEAVNSLSSYFNQLKPSKVQPQLRQSTYPDINIKFNEEPENEPSFVGDHSIFKPTNQKQEEKGTQMIEARDDKDEIHKFHVAHRLDDETPELRSGIPDTSSIDRKETLASATGQLFSTSDSSKTPEFLKWPANVDIEHYIPSPTSPFTAFRYRKPSQRFFQTKANDIIWDNWWASWSRAAAPRSISALVANEFGLVSGGVGIRDGVTDFTTGWRKFLFTEYTNRVNEEVSVGVTRGRYGFFVDRSNLSRATAVEIIARYFASSTLIDFVDRDYGQRISFRNFDISIRHDFDEFVNPDPSEFATDCLITFGGVGLALSTDVKDSRYGLTVGLKGRQVSVYHDFDERMSELVLNWRHGGQAMLETDFVDPYNERMFTRLGFGKLGRAYFAVGGGIAADGVPEASIEAHVPDVGVFTRFLDIGGGDHRLQSGLVIGKFTYLWDSVLALQNLRIPNIFGLNPDQVKKFLLGTPSVLE